MKYAYVLTNNTVGPCIEGPEGFDPAASYPYDLPEGQWIECPVEIEPGATYAEGVFTNLPKPPEPLTQLAFLRRFTQQERVAIRGSAVENPYVADYLELLTLAQEVRLDDPDTISGVNGLESAGLLGAGRAAEILAT